MIFFCKIIFDFFLAEGHDIMFVTSTRIYRKYNIAMYFLRRIIFHFPSKEKISFFRGTKPSFQIIQEISYSRQIFLKRPSFQNIWRKYHISMYFFRERSSFIFCLKNKIIFSGKRNIIFPDNTRKIIFQCSSFGKTIFSGHLENKNMAFRAVTSSAVASLQIYWERRLLTVSQC